MKRIGFNAIKSELSTLTFNDRDTKAKLPRCRITNCEGVTQVTSQWSVILHRSISNVKSNKEFASIVWKQKRWLNSFQETKNRLRWNIAEIYSRVWKFNQFYLYERRSGGNHQCPQADPKTSKSTKIVHPYTINYSAKRQVYLSFYLRGSERWE